MSSVQHIVGPRLVAVRLAQVVCISVAGLIFGACDKKEQPLPAQAATESAPAPYKAIVYTVGTDASYAPFESLNDRGDIVGFDIDVVRAVAEKAGIEVKFVNTPWGSIFSALDQGDRDMLASAIAITTERKLTMDSSNPYFRAQQLIVLREASSAARFVELRVGVQIGTIGDDAVTKLMASSNARIKRFESTLLALKDLESGGVDAVLAESGLVRHYMVKNPGSKFRTAPYAELVPQQYGIALKKGNAELLDKLNRGLLEIEADGSYDAIYAKYFGQRSAEAGDSTAMPAEAARVPAHR